MVSESYEEYIRSILGYPTNNLYNINQNYNDENYNLINLDLEKLYPEIYKLVYPMIRTKCNYVRGSVTNEEIENITDEIYYAIETDERNELIRITQTSSNILKTEEKKKEIKASEKITEKRETRQVNKNLRDLIKILLIRELISNISGFDDIRPPYLGVPGFGLRPPIRPNFRPGRSAFNREFENINYDIFEY